MWDWLLSQHIAEPGRRRHKEHDPTRKREGVLPRGNVGFGGEGEG